MRQEEEANQEKQIPPAIQNMDIYVPRKKKDQDDIVNYYEQENKFISSNLPKKDASKSSGGGLKVIQEKETD